MHEINKIEYGSMGVIDFNKLWKYMEVNGYNKTYLRNNGIHANTISKLVNNQNISCEVLARLCYILKCDLDEICSYKKP